MNQGVSSLEKVLPGAQPLLLQLSAPGSMPAASAASTPCATSAAGAPAIAAASIAAAGSGGCKQANIGCQWGSSQGTHAAGGGDERET